MHAFLIVLGTFMVVIGAPVFVIATLIQLFRKRNWKKMLVYAAACFFVGIFLGVFGSSKGSDATKSKDALSDGAYVSSDNKGNDGDHDKEEIDFSNLTEEEYKKSCEELWHDDVFFSDDDLEGANVKVHLFLEENMFFEDDAMYNDMAAEFINKHDLKRSFYNCGVLREDSNSYVGGQISMYFSNEYGYKDTDFKTGDKVIAYGEVVIYSTNTVDGYNDCSIIPKYIEKIE